MKPILFNTDMVKAILDGKKTMTRRRSSPGCSWARSWSRRSEEEELMDTVKFTLPYPPTKRGKAAWNKRFSLNAYWAGKHYRQRAQDARDIHSLVILALRQGRVKKQPFQGPVEVVFRWDDGLDVDNHAAIGKMVVDAMKGWVIQDDSPRWVKRVVHEFWDGGCVGVEVREIE